VRKYAKWGLGALALLCAFGLGRGDNAYTESDLARAREEAYNSGYQTGYSEGTLSNQEALYTEAFSEGRLKGYDEGLNEGLLQGAAQGQNTALTAAGDTYTQGYDEGYAQGYAKKEKDDQPVCKYRQFTGKHPVSSKYIKGYYQQIDCSYKQLSTITHPRREKTSAFNLRLCQQNIKC
jgi:flagellar biosynthesis/type III secretory pathway protein FliH